eukprot:8864624-Pyramimonas_sp.AAC.1
MISQYACAYLALSTRLTLKASGWSCSTVGRHMFTTSAGVGDCSLFCSAPVNADAILSAAPAIQG